jgi:hypothetical protein
LEAVKAVSDSPILTVLDLLRQDIKGWEKSITARRCKNLKTDSNSPDRSCSARTYLIEINLEQIADESERQHLLSLPTSFYLEPEDVHRLKAAARELLSTSAEFQRLVSDLR